MEGHNSQNMHKSDNFQNFGDLVSLRLLIFCVVDLDYSIVLKIVDLLANSCADMTS